MKNKIVGVLGCETCNSCKKPKPHKDVNCFKDSKMNKQFVVCIDCLSKFLYSRKEKTC